MEALGGGSRVPAVPASLMALLELPSVGSIWDSHSHDGGFSEALV